MTYGGYLDLATGKTLTCEPGGSYDITPVSAVSPVPSDGRFTEPEPPAKKSGMTEVATSDTPDTGGKD
jgi:hypothetical protein